LVWSLELISLPYQRWYIIFLSQQINFTGLSAVETSPEQLQQYLQRTNGVFLSQHFNINIIVSQISAEMNRTDISDLR
jgi:hypothetical protein